MATKNPPPKEQPKTKPFTNPKSPLIPVKPKNNPPPPKKDK